MLALFIGIPVLELYLLIQVGGQIGAFPTVFLTIATAMTGIWLVRRQGVSVLFRVREVLDRGETPALEMLEGTLLLVAGLALLLPGFATDTLGFVLLVPVVRRVIVRYAVRRVRVNDTVVVTQYRSEESGRSSIEGDWKRLDD